MPAKSILPFLIFLCSLPSPLFASSPWKAVQEIVIQADLTSNRGRQKALAEEGLKMAKACVERYPEEAGCYYYRAQATGIFNKNMVFYIGKVREMLKDWKKAFDLDPKFDFGGPDRMFAEVYSALPPFGPKDVRRNLKKALEHIEKAIEISNYPTNHLDRAEILILSKRKGEAKEVIQEAKRHMPEWSDHPYYPSWVQNVRNLEKKLY